MRRWMMVLVAGLLGVFAVSAQVFDRQGMVENITMNLILPANETFYATTLELQQAADAFADDPEAATLTVLQAAWKKTLLDWQPVGLIGLRDLMSQHYRVFKWPTKETFIEKFIAGDAVLDADFMAGQGSNSVGLPAMEYLIFSPTGDAAVLATFANAPRRLAYVTALAAALVNTADEIRLYWSPDGQNYAATFIAADGDGSSITSAMNILTNELLANLEGIAKVRLGAPLGLEDGDPRPLQSVSHLSAMTNSQLIADIIAAQQLFSGGEGLGLDDYLGSVGQAALAQQIEDAFTQVITDYQAITLPLTQAVVDDREAMTGVYTAMKTLNRLLKTDLTQQLGVSITFSEADGD